MSWRIVSVSSLSKLDYKMGYLIVRNRDASTRIRMSEISVLILESTAVSLTAYLLRELERQKIDVILCDEKRTPYGMLSPRLFADLWRNCGTRPMGRRGKS